MGRNPVRTGIGAVFSFLFAVFFTISAWGQATTSLRGVVTDPSAAAVPNAKVTLSNPATNFTRTTTTATDGSYTFAQVLPGTYALTVEASGFQKYEQQGVVLQVSLPATVNVRLTVGSLSQVVSVVGVAEALNTTDASLGETMGPTQIVQLPLEARNVAGLLSAQPGVVYTSDRADINTTNYDTRSGAVNGERSDQSNITLDGVDVNQQVSGTAFTSVLPVTVDSVEEFRVTTSNYGANEGRSSGAQMTLVTKGGTNNFHGSLYEYNRNSAGEANDFFIKSSEAATGSPNVPPKLIRNIFGGSIGGPIKKNRLFFFLNYEGRRDAEAASADRPVPSQTLRDGIIEYICDDPTMCPGGTSVTGVSGKSYPVAAGTYALGPAQLKAMDPLGIGPDAAVLKFFNTFPEPNDFTTGDGYNFVGFRFAAPDPTRYNWLIGRFDYKLTSNGNQSLFFRGSGRDDVASGQPYLPGTIPSSTRVDLSKGFVAGYTGIFGSHWVNNFRYGLTRQSLGTAGNTNQPWVQMRGLNDLTSDDAIVYGDSFTLPVHNFVDDVSWTHGSHTLQFGAEAWLIRRASNSTLSSFSSGSTNAAWTPSVGIANTGTPMDPAISGYPTVSSNFDNNYDFPLVAMMGVVTEVNAQYNYHLNPNLTGTPLAQGAPVPRHFSWNEFDLYWQDVWQARSNLTITYGLRWAMMNPIGETAGQEVAPTFSLGPWFQQRSINMRNGIPSSTDPLVTFAPAGPSYGTPGYYGAQTRDFAPRLSLAYTPQAGSGILHKLFGTGKTVIRAGFGMYYDHFGQALANTFDQAGSFGLSTSLVNPAGFETVASSPRITSVNVVPTVDQNGVQIFTPAPPAVYPETFPDTFSSGGFAIAWGLDSSLKSPYSYAIDLSVDRQLPGNMTLSVSYVGHLAHRLLVDSDVAEPLDFVDTKTGIDYFSAATRFSQLSRQGVPTSAITPAMVGPTAQYWTDTMAAQSSYPLFDGGCYCGPTTTNLLQAMYDTMSNFTGNETTGLEFIDEFGLPTTPAMGLNTFYNPQYSALYAWRSIGYSNYNALQVSLQKRMGNGLLFGFNYTFSKSLDIESNAERTGNYNGLGGDVINAWSPYQLYGPSDFDLRHQINGDWVYNMPFGRGRKFAGQAGGLENAIVGGWQLSGLARWTTGFPTNIGTCFCFQTDFQLSSSAIPNGHIQTGRSIVNGFYNIFPNPSGTIANPLLSIQPNTFYVPFPGQSGVRNAIRGDGYAGLDMGLAKTWTMPYNEHHSLEFRWDVFNVPNQKRFDVQTASLELDHENTFGRYTGLLTNPRVMQFALRYQF
jgi:hypothetical protein